MDMVIRICTNEESFDWAVRPDQVTFSGAMDLLRSRLLDRASSNAFEYEDEEGDRITVRSDEEMITMVNYHLSNWKAGGPNYIEIYPRVGKPPGQRNIHNLKVNTKPVSDMVSHNIPLQQSSGSRKQQPQDLQEILSAGATLKQSDLRQDNLLGEGNAGTVWKAYHHSSKIAMAVKIMKLGITDLEKTQKEIMSELQVLYTCRSPVIIAFYGAFFVEDTIHICTEFMDGGSLDKYGRIIEPVLGRMTVSIVSGLKYLWSLKILHRDVKPSNVLVNTQGQVKLCDFGVSVRLLESVAKTVIGTHAYMAPERIMGQGYSVKSDVWSLGISLFELAVGRFPYQILPGSVEQNQSEISLPLEKLDLNADDLPSTETNYPMVLVEAIVYEDPPKLPANTVSSLFEDFIHRCIVKDPDSRPLPESLMSHTLITSYNDGNWEIVANWVCSNLHNVQNRVQMSASRS